MLIISSKKLLEIAASNASTTEDEAYTGFKKGDLVVLVTGISETGTTNTFKVARIGYFKIGKNF